MTRHTLFIVLGLSLLLLAGQSLRAQTGTVKLPTLLPAPQPGAQAPPQPGLASLQTGTQTFADAAYVTPKEFLATLRDVQVAVKAPSSTTRYVSNAELLEDIADALAAYNIAVRSNSAVHLDVTVDENISEFYFDGDRSDTQDVHDVALTLAFTTRGVVRRGGKLMAVVAAPVKVEVISTVFQNNSTRRAFVGDEIEEDMEKLIPRLMRGALASAAGNDFRDTTPWYAAGWTASQKAAAHQEFTALMRAPAPPAQHFAGLAVLPTMSTKSGGSTTDGCGAEIPSIAADHWREVFRSRGWTQTSPEAPLFFDHAFTCDEMDVLNTPDYTRIWNVASLLETNFVFMLNGKIVRKLAFLQWWEHLEALDPDDSKARAIDQTLKIMDLDINDLPRATPASAPVPAR